MLDKAKLPVLVFDFDGTLADTFTAGLRIINQLSQEFGFKAVEDHDIEFLKNHPYQFILKYLEIPVLKVPMIAQKARTELRQEIEQIAAIEGLAEVLPSLHQRGYRLGILTSNSAENVRAFLRRHRLEIFDFIWAESSLWGKRQKLKRLMRQFKLEPEHITYIGDETRDIEAARGNQMRVVAVTWGFNAATLLRKYTPDSLIQHPEELLTLFPSLS